MNPKRPGRTMVLAIASFTLTPLKSRAASYGFQILPSLTHFSFISFEQGIKASIQKITK